MSVYNEEALAAAHRLEPGDRCTMFGQVVGVPTGVGGFACVVVARIEKGWPGAKGSGLDKEADLLQEVAP